METLKKGFLWIAALAILLTGNGISASAQKLTSFEKKGKYGFKDETGKVVIEAKYKFVKQFSEDLAAVQFKDKWGYIDKTGAEVIPFNFVDASPFSEGKARVQYSVIERFGYIDNKGLEVLPFEFGAPGDFHNGFTTEAALVDFVLKLGFINDKGVMVVQPTYDQVTYEKGLWKVKLDDKYGYLDSVLNLVVPIEYNVSYGFTNGYAAVNIGGAFNQYYTVEGGKWGFIDKSGKVIVPVQYDKVESFNAAGIAKVTLNGEEFTINTKGERVQN
jgi:hypothetical protein